MTSEFLFLKSKKHATTEIDPNKMKIYQRKRLGSILKCANPLNFILEIIFNITKTYYKNLVCVI